ncbi:MAG: hypothetical protein FJ135_04325 [Deltaproteobacteria bacterium]|nr:hypothetical protein [Deltaproteobacteria bacterium]
MPDPCGHDGSKEHPGGGPNRGFKRQEVVEAVQAGEVQVLLATGQLIGEGFDCPGLSALLLATPSRFSGRLLQYLGRVLRPAPGKDKARVYDCLTVMGGVLVNAARVRA